MVPMDCLLGAISKAVPYVSIDRAVDETEDHKALLADSDSAGYLGEDEGRKGSRQPVHLSSTLGISSGGPRLSKQTQDQESITECVQTGFHLSPSSVRNALLRPPRSRGRRSSSSSQVETRSRSKGPASPDTALQREIIAKLSEIRNTNTSRPSRHRCERNANNPVMKDEEPRTAFKWTLSVRSNSDPDLRKSSRAQSRPYLNKPLKTYLKQKAKSANTTPPNGSMMGLKGWLEDQKLRRMKIVDFEEAISKPVASRVRISSSTLKHQRNRLEVLQRTPSCPGTSTLARRSPADPALTRTDVHVIAIAPTSSEPSDLNPMQPGEVKEADPATPTMQIIESSNSSYEVIWDDVPPEHSARTRRRSSSASQALEAIGLTATRSLECVNTKLTEWSGTWNSPSESFKPTIVVFPDDDGRRPHFECAIVDHEDIEIFAPPNSERVSAVHSRQPSRPVSARVSRATSQDEFDATRFPQDTSLEDAAVPTEQPLVVPDPDAWSAHLVAARRKLGAPSPERKLSNIEEADVKFRNHRDSVIVAHSRLIQSGGVRSELFAHRDSVSIAKKRMHAKNHATPAARHMHRPESKSEPGPFPEDDAAAIPPLPIVKGHAAEALRKGNPVPILRPSDSAGPRHIRIED